MTEVEKEKEVDSPESPFIPQVEKPERPNETLDKDLATAKDKVPESHNSPFSLAKHPRCYYALACFCPGLLAGNITTRLHRELPLPCCSHPYCYDFQVGAMGCQICCMTCAGCAALWPWSPLLACYVFRERWKLKVVYNDDDDLKPNSLGLFCNWPLNLKNQHEYVSNMHKEGLLTFAWDYALFRDLLQPRPAHLSHTLMIFGPASAAENEFLRKLMLRVDYQQTPLSESLQEVQGIEKIRTGVKPLPIDNKGNIRILEIWEIPPSEYTHNALNRFLMETSVSLYLFDLSSPQHMHDTKNIFYQHSAYDHITRVIIIIKSHTLSPHSSIEEEEIVMWARKTSSIWFLLSLQYEQEILKISKEIDKLLHKKENS